MNEQPWMSWITELRARLSSPAPQRLPPDDARRTAVMVPLYVNAGELWALLAKHSDALPHHQGQIVFPGGRLEAGEDAWTAALREAREEVGVEPRAVLRLGELDEEQTPSGVRVVPCVGAVAYPLRTRINRREIAELLPIPVRAFANPQLVEERMVRLDGREHLTRIYHVAGRQVWGLTARIVYNLLVRLGLEPDGPAN